MSSRWSKWLLAIALSQSAWTGLLDRVDTAYALEDPPTYLLTIGTYGSGPGQFGLPHGLSASTLGRLYVADADNYRVSAFAFDGTFVGQWGSYGTGPGQFVRPWNVLATRDGYVYVADGNSHGDGNRIQKFTADGTYVLSFGTYGAGDGQFNAPWGLAEDAIGNIYVSDYGGRIQVFSAGGTFLRKFGSYGSAPGQFIDPRGMVIRDGTTLYVIDAQNQRVQYLTTAGILLGLWSGLSPTNCCPYGIALDADGNILVADTWQEQIKKLTATGTLLAQWGTRGSTNAQFYLPHGISVDGLGDIYIADALNRRVQKFSGTSTTPVSIPRTSWGRIKQMYR